jgi:hypothetical protein
MARISGLAFANLYFGIAPASGELLTSFGEGPTAIPASPFQITVAQGATFADDYGVVNAATGLPLTRVAPGTINAGQYSVGSGGVYTFSTADNAAGVRVLISYTYNGSAAGTQQIVITNALMGTTPTFQAQFFSTFQGVPLNFKAYNCVANKLNLNSKLDDFMIPELDFELFANASGTIGNFSFGEVS